MSKELGPFATGMLAGIGVTLILIGTFLIPEMKSQYMNHAFQNECAHYDAKEHGLVWNRAVTP